jgi:diacylglycerol kinase family enzyme
MQENKKRKHIFVINPKSFPMRHEMATLVAGIHEYFRAEGEGENDEYFVHISAFARDAILIVQNHLTGLDADTILRVYAVGGDGILFDCLNGIAEYPNTELAVMPFGNGSDFVRAFGPENYAAFRNIALQVTSPTIATDVIHCGANYAINFCSLGVGSAGQRKIASLIKRNEKTFKTIQFLNRARYLMGATAASFDKTILRQSYKINCDGESLDGKYLSINITNGPYFAAGRCAVPYAVPDDGKLDLMMVKEAGSFTVIRSMSSIINGKYYKTPLKTVRREVRRINIESDAPIFVTLDGEYFNDSSVNIEIIPKAINIVSPGNLQYKMREAYRDK